MLRTIREIQNKRAGAFVARHRWDRGKKKMMPEKSISKLNNKQRKR